ncbi:MAG: anthranilate phosphoribosyltransferase [Thermodesulfobacteriota bacterium]|nr:anthranilate phosphoribosyltransferase [Thermodesulfobacteriota bacterium]
MIKDMIQKAVKGRDLSEDEMVSVMDEIMEGHATDAQIGAFITALRMKGETIAEITGAARVMRAKATPIRVQDSAVSIDRDEINVDEETLVDTCGTGGDGTNTFNVSTTTAFVVAGGGLKVAKHGNRSVSSQCGSADVLGALGVNLDVTPKVVEECIKTIGIGFLYAPKLHGAMKYAIGPRREVGIRSLFNVLGPLTNPAGANVQVLGVYDPALTSVLAEVLRRLGSTSAMVVFGEGSLDEISIVGPTQVSELRNDMIKEYRLEPEEVGMVRAGLSDIKGGNAQENAAIVREVLKGQPGARRDMVLLNAGAAFYAAGKAADMHEGIKVAAESIDSGMAAQRLDQLIEETNRG